MFNFRVGMSHACVVVAYWFVCLEFLIATLIVTWRHETLTSIAPPHWVPMLSWEKKSHYSRGSECGKTKDTHNKLHLWCIGEKISYVVVGKKS